MPGFIAGLSFAALGGAILSALFGGPGLRSCRVGRLRSTLLRGTPRGLEGWRLMAPDAVPGRNGLAALNEAQRLCAMSRLDVLLPQP